MKNPAKDCSVPVLGRKGTTLSSAADIQHEPAKCSVDGNNGQQDTNVLASLARLVAIGIQQTSTRNQALLVERRLVSTVVTTIAIRGASVVSVCKFIDHHALEDIALVINVVKHVAPEGVQVSRANHETHCAHPETVGEGGGGKSDDEDRTDTGDEDNKRLGGNQVKEEPHDPHPEASSRAAEVTKPVHDNAEEQSDDEEIRKPSQEVADKERRGSVKTIGALLHENGAVLEVSRDVSDSHERHEGTSKEDSIGESLQIVLRCFQAQPDCSHHHSQTHVHGDTDAIGDDVTVRLDEVTMDKCNHDSKPVSADLLVVIGLLGRRVAVQDLAVDSVHLFCVEARALPCAGDHLKLRNEFASVMSEIGVNEVDDEFGGVHVERDGEAAGIEERLDVLDWSRVCRVAMGEEEKLVEHCKC